jgi:hypothetical protein
MNFSLSRSATCEDNGALKDSDAVTSPYGVGVAKMHQCMLRKPNTSGCNHVRHGSCDGNRSSSVASGVG